MSSIDKTVKILLVEDSKITRRMECKVLNDLGFNNVIEADDGEHAIDLLSKHPDVAVIISDWNMPNMGGIELLKWVRQQEKYRNLPFILATGRAQKKEVVEAAEAGASNIITKPFAPAELLKVMEETFSGSTLQTVSDEIPTRELVLEASGKPILHIAHIQITDHLTLGVAKYLIDTGRVSPRHFAALQTICMTSWNPVQEALEKGTVDGALILAPIAMDLFAYNVPIRVVLLAHKNGSICVRKKEPIRSLENFFRNKTFCIPHELSIHHIISHMFMSELGLRAGITGSREGDFYYEVVPPVKMPEFLKMNPDASGFMVAEPIGTKAIAEGIAEQVFLSSEVWQNHPCCLVAVRSEVIEQHGEAVEEFVRLMVEAGNFIARKPEKAAEIGVSFLDPQKVLGLKVPILKNVLTESQGIRTDDLRPDTDALDKMLSYMSENMAIDLNVDVGSFVDMSFCDAAYKESSSYIPRPSRLLNVKALIARINEDIREKRISAKSLLGQEGKYLIFNLCNQQYGIDVLNVKEIVGIMPIREIPQAPSFVKGVINLRGRIIPVIDLRLKLSMPQAEYNEKTCIVILEIPLEQKVFHLGLVVDTVSHVETIKARDVEPPPRFGSGVSVPFVKAMAKSNGNVKVLLDVMNLFEKMELAKIASV
ncbi:MAG: chemotaxis protein CheW [Syntrophobacterales bacterium]|nr:chemotaxis protein CheW [Syntrophobacterales bacterium]